MIASWTQPEITTTAKGTATTVAPKISAWNTSTPSSTPPAPAKSMNFPINPDALNVQRNQYGEPISTFTSQPTKIAPVDNSLKTFQSKSVGEATPVMQLPEGVKNTVDQIKQDPLTLHSNVKQTVNDMWKAVKDPVMQEGSRIKDLFESKSLSQGAGNALKVVTGGANVVFSPITALFNGANDVPILGTVSRLVSLPFQSVGEAGSDISGQVIDKLPISQQTKDQIKPGIQEIFALAGQIALGGGIGKAGLDPISPIWDKLKAKFGETDATTIVNKAQELANQKLKTTKPEPFPTSDPTGKTEPVVPKPPETFPKSEAHARVLDGETSVEELNQTKNSLATSRVGEKPGGIERATAEIQAGNKPPVKIRTLEDGTKFIEDGRHHLQAATDLGLKSYPTEDVTNKYKIDKPLFRGATAENMLKDKGRGISFTTDKDVADRFSKQDAYGFPQEGSVGEFYLKPDAKILNPNNLTAQIIKGDLTRENIIKYARENGYDGVDLTKAIDPKLGYKPETELRILNKEAIYKSEGGKVAKASIDINESLVKKGFDSLPEDQQAKYSPTTKAEQIQKISELMGKDLEKAKSMALGDTPVPNDILPQPLFNAIEAHATETGDIQTLRGLAKSPLASQLSEAGQALGSHGYNDNPNSVVARIKELKKNLIEKAGGEKEIAKKKTEALKEAKKVTLSKEDQSWEKFLDKIKC